MNLFQLQLNYGELIGLKIDLELIDLVERIRFLQLAPLAKNLIESSFLQQISHLNQQDIFRKSLPLVRFDLSQVAP